MSWLFDKLVDRLRMTRKRYRYYLIISTNEVIRVALHQKCKKLLKTDEDNAL